VVGAAVALPAPRVADGAAPDGHRAGASARALAVLETDAAGLRAAAAPRDAVVLTDARRAPGVGHARARLAALRSAAAAEREQVSREIDVRAERHAQRGRLAGAAARRPRGVASDPVDDARAQRGVGWVRDGQRWSEQAPRAGAGAVAAGIRGGRRTERQRAVVGAARDLRERRAQVGNDGRQRNADAGPAEVQAAARERSGRADAARAILRRVAGLAGLGPTAGAHIGQQRAAVVLHHAASPAPDIRGELQHGRLWRAARAGGGRLARAAVRAHLSAGATRSAGRIARLVPRLDAVAAAGLRAVRVAAVSVHGVPVVAFLVAGHDPVAADGRYRRRGDVHHGALAGRLFRFADENELILVRPPRLALAGRDAGEENDGLPRLIVPLPLELDLEVVGEGSTGRAAAQVRLGQGGKRVDLLHPHHPGERALERHRLAGRIARLVRAQ